MKIQATVIIPTHNHAQLLNYSIPSVLKQTVSDIEILVIGDGVKDDTRIVIDNLMQQDKRIKFFDFPKGPRLGEPYRHEIIMNHAQGEIVCYHCDDDLMLPDHVEKLQNALKNNDFAHSLSLCVLPNGEIKVLLIDMASAECRQMVIGDKNRIHLSNIAHTLKFYYSLPGWQATPENVATDHFICRQMLLQHSCRAVTILQPTVIIFPSGLRKTWTIDERIKEIDHWQNKFSDSDSYKNFYDEVQDIVIRTALASDLQYSRLEKEYLYLKKHHDYLFSEARKQRNIKIILKSLRYRIQQKLIRWLYNGENI